MEVFKVIKVICINEQGFLVRDDFINDESELTNLTVRTPLPTDGNGRQLPFYKARWVNNKWIEGATQEEIEEIENTPKIPTEIEKLRMEQAQANAELVQLIMMMGGA